MEITATGYLFISIRINGIKADVYPLQTGILHRFRKFCQ